MDPCYFSDDYDGSGCLQQGGGIFLDFHGMHGSDLCYHNALPTAKKLHNASIVSQVPSVSSVFLIDEESATHILRDCPVSRFKPQPFFFKLNVDGSCTENQLGYGGIIRDDKGNHVSSFNHYPGTGNVIIAELWALQLSTCYRPSNNGNSDTTFGKPTHALMLWQTLGDFQNRVSQSIVIRLLSSSLIFSLINKIITSLAVFAKALVPIPPSMSMHWNLPSLLFQNVFFVSSALAIFIVYTLCVGSVIWSSFG
ncbi:putative ribonuclease H-like domain-containing protein [Senna tora]|uniref:Putative ribonuclease H-like domain-containing protein n=1 Tax=Senna tora TaxID=362788 RepID=A0A834W9M8_9FABA|nr:putative ribonuclease H-like domain-containing protein [Senna tora]